MIFISSSGINNPHAICVVPINFGVHLEKLFLVFFVCLIFGCASPVRQQQTSTYSTSGDSAHWFRADGTINWEAEKQEKKIPTDHVIFHHTSGRANRSLDELSNLERERLYVPRFNPSIPDPNIPKGTLVQSGHYRKINSERAQVFYAYHWLIRQDGKCEQLLNDDEVGWHCGNWDMNNRSIAICFDGNLVGSKPTDQQYRAAAALLAAYMAKYKITAGNVMGHDDVVATDCPGEWFKAGGKDKLIQLAVKPDQWVKYKSVYDQVLSKKP